MFSTIVLCGVALYLVVQAAVTNSRGMILPSIVWKVIPNCLAVVLVLIAFKVI